MKEREFYRRAGWYAVLDHRPMARGYVLLVREMSGANCPDELTSRTLSGFDLATAEVVPLMRKRFGVANVLIASLRGKHPHVHWHLIPQDDVLLKEWRQKRGYKEGHVFEFLAWLEQRKARDPLPNTDLAGDVEALRELARYGST